MHRITRGRRIHFQCAPFPAGIRCNILMNILGVGQCSIDHLCLIREFPTPDTKAEVSNWSIQGGGPVATALVAARRLGAHCTFAGVVGDDPEAELIRQGLRSESINTSLLISRPDSLSQRAFIAVDPDNAHRTIFWQRPTGAALTPDELPAPAIQHADMLLLDGLMHDVSMHAARIARASNVAVMYDAGTLRPGSLELAALCDYVIASERFALSLGYDPENPGAFTEKAAAMFPGVFAVTLGSRGSRLFMESMEVTKLHIPALQGVEVIDTTGAGDVFHGALAVALCEGMAIRAAMEFASCAAALSCRGLGGRGSLPTRPQVEEALRRYRTTEP